MVRVSDHALLKLQQRVDLPDISKAELLEEWEGARFVNVRSFDRGEERYSERHDVLMIERGGVIQTVLKGEYLGYVTRTKLCEWCGKDVIGRSTCLKCGGWKL